jgi:hypothetical protein
MAVSSFSRNLSTHLRAGDPLYPETIELRSSSAHLYEMAAVQMVAWQLKGILRPPAPDGLLFYVAEKTAEAPILASGREHGGQDGRVLTAFYSGEHPVYSAISRFESARLVMRHELTVLSRRSSDEILQLSEQTIECLRVEMAPRDERERLAHLKAASSNMFDLIRSRLLNEIDRGCQDCDSTWSQLAVSEAESTPGVEVRPPFYIPPEVRRRIASMADDENPSELLAYYLDQSKRR